ncbi:iron-siderophore ABC transporter substrate-binding protein [Propionibacterium acidifaciens]|uniref:iron-siderophore ABC transporter substrate-binding protein n=1 Tax=Propionibacterium acidifaciens TaxID=556499 RepID=UPI00040E099A|nr:iron-siderophore ABC transporter substrate-binding protein [Propionibacterium acidifaciens]
MTARIQRRTFSLGALAAAAALAGCSSDNSGSSGSGSSASSTSAPASYLVPRSMAEGMGSGAADGAWPRTVAHHKGETTIENEPQRLVVISTGQLDVALTMGIVPVGSTGVDGSKMVPQYLYDAFPDNAAGLDAITYVGSRTEPSIESIANLDADLILVNSAGKNIDSLYESLTALAPTVVTKGTGLYWKQDFQLIADALGRLGQAQDWLTSYQEDAAGWGAGLSTVPTVSFLNKTSDRTRVYGLASFPGSLAEDAGLSRPDSQRFEDTSQDIDDESLDQADADWIFYGVQSGDGSEVTSLPLWGTLGAVSNDQAVQVDNDPFYLNAGPTAAATAMAVLKEHIG